MKSVRNPAGLAAGPLFILLMSCGGDPLDYETAMELLRERTNDVVRLTFNATPRLDGQDPAVTEAYQQLIDEHVISCKKNAEVGTLCEPGPAGDELAQPGVSELSLTAGRWVPASIVAIRRTGRNSAVADVRMSFQPGQLFRDYQSAFAQIQGPGQALTQNASFKEGKLVHATFQRYAEGWHVESVE